MQQPSLQKIKMTMSTICSGIRGQQQRQQQQRQQRQQEQRQQRQEGQPSIPFVTVTMATIGAFSTNWREMDEEREIWMISSWWSIDFLHETNQPETMSANQGCLSDHSLSALTSQVGKSRNKNKLLSWFFRRGKWSQQNGLISLNFFHSRPG